MDHAAVDISEAKVAALMAVGKPLVVQPEQMEHRGLQIVHVYGFFCDAVAQFTGCPISQAWLQTTASHPNGEGVFMMIAANEILIGLALQHRCAAKLTRPYHECLVEEATLLQILHQRCEGAVYCKAFLGELRENLAVMVPTTSGLPRLAESAAACDVWPPQRLPNAMPPIDRPMSARISRREMRGMLVIPS